MAGLGLLAITAFNALPAGAAKTSYGVSTAQSEAAAVKRVHWTSNVAVTYANGSWTFTSDGLPSSTFVATNYAVPANPFAVSATGATIHSSSSVLTDQNYDYTLPLVPKYAKSTTTTNQGPIGFLLDGAALYNPYEANHSTVATADNFVTTVNGVSASFLDDCDGHPGPGGQYHYHGLPACLVAYATSGVTEQVTSVSSTNGTATTAVSEDNVAARKPVILGFAFDGFGIYDNVAMNGSTVPVSALDACNGIFSPVPGYPHGVYHYVLENVKGARSSIGCYHGVVSSAYTRALEENLSGSSNSRTDAQQVSTGPATATSLAASTGEDALLREMLRLSPRSHDC
ncbi:MAG: YHYH protein [Acidimicrobiales bacterium]